MIKYPGKISDEQMQEWFFNAATMAGLTDVKEKPNPCLALFGNGPDGKRCKDCRLLVRNEKSRCYFKCPLRGRITNGKATDHKANWPACGKFQPL